MEHIKRNHNAKSPRPSRCDLETCSENIPPDQPYFVDRVWAMKKPSVHADGTVSWHDKIPYFCSENCRETHRAVIFDRRSHNGRPSP